MKGHLLLFQQVGDVVFCIILLVFNLMFRTDFGVERTNECSGWVHVTKVSSLIAVLNASKTLLVSDDMLEV